MIEGVELKSLVTHSDERGFFREIVRGSEGIVREYLEWAGQQPDLHDSFAAAQTTMQSVGVLRKLAS